MCVKILVLLAALLSTPLYADYTIDDLRIMNTEEVQALIDHYKEVGTYKGINNHPVYRQIYYRAMPMGWVILLLILCVPLGLCVSWVVFNCTSLTKSVYIFFMMVFIAYTLLILGVIKPKFDYVESNPDKVIIEELEKFL